MGSHACRRGRTSRSRSTRWPGARSWSNASAKELVENLLPPRHAFGGPLGREIHAAEVPFLRPQGRIERRDARINRQVLGGTKDVLAFWRGEKVDQELARIRMGRLSVHRNRGQRDGRRLHPDPVDRRALLGADHRMRFEICSAIAYSPAITWSS